METLINSLDSLNEFVLGDTWFFTLYNGFSDRLFHQWLQDNEYIVWLCILLYLTAVYIGPKLAQNLHPVELTSTVVLWNSMVTVSSTLFGIFMARERFQIITNHGWKYSLCHMDHYTGPVALWTAVFVLFKILLFGDTVIMMARKRRAVMFSHWFHHASVTWLAWDVYGRNQPVSRWLGTINTWTLAVMYGLITAAIQFPSTRRTKPLGPALAVVEVGFISLHETSIINRPCKTMEIGD